MKVAAVKVAPDRFRPDRPGVLTVRVARRLPGARRCGDQGRQQRQSGQSGPAAPFGLRKGDHKGFHAFSMPPFPSNPYLIRRKDRVSQQAGMRSDPGKRVAASPQARPSWRWVSPVTPCIWAPEKFTPSSRAPEKSAPSR